jgi:hypothetical protein
MFRSSYPRRLFSLSLGARLQKSECRPFVDGDVVRLIALDEVLRFVFCSVVDIPFESHVGNNFLRDDAPNPARFRVPFNMVAAFECLEHRTRMSFLDDEHPRAAGSVLLRDVEGRAGETLFGASRPRRLAGCHALPLHRQNDAELGLAAHHARVSLARSFKRISFDHGAHAGHLREMQRVLLIR